MLTLLLLLSGVAASAEVIITNSGELNPAADPGPADQAEAPAGEAAAPPAEGGAPATQADTPAPDVPVAPPAPVPTVTKHPTDENLYTGGKAVFIAKANDCTSITWKIVAPDGVTYDVADFVAKYPGLSAFGENTEQLVICDVTSKISGSRAYAVFSNASGSVTSNYAVVHVTATAAETPEPTPMPTPEPAPEPTPMPTPAPAPVSTPVPTMMPQTVAPPEGTVPSGGAGIPAQGTAAGYQTAGEKGENEKQYTLLAAGGGLALFIGTLAVMVISAATPKGGRKKK